LLTGYWSALRCGSLLKLKRRDVDLQSGWLNVRAKITKQKRGKRFRLGDDALAALRQIWHPERELLFPLSFERRAFFRRLARIIRTAGVAPSTRRAMTLMHKLRRTTATLLAAREGIHAACELLDHSSTYVTRLYIDSSKLPGCDKTKSLPVLTGDVHQPPPRAIAATPAELVAEARQLFAVGFLRPAAGSAAAAVALHCRGQEMADPVRQLLRRLRSAAAGRQSSAARIAKLLAAAESIVSLPVSHPSLQESKL
jgi:hypothetical protein